MDCVLRENYNRRRKITEVIVTEMNNIRKTRVTFRSDLQERYGGRVASISVLFGYPSLVDSTFDLFGEKDSRFFVAFSFYQMDTDVLNA
ncbi:hypothetical protein TNIN_377111 [Trichonephila inaurata madagascariensis]|uniref:Uncharacterized protein n=1 Tax=Trichonephila inaurata madagascariensis TaxID=2747483 RepID=A0A8X7CNQ7_9ARAC|nr:hypothetical protein TNIN_377111 [Trichonephila inaurata madagascariensis]